METAEAREEIRKQREENRAHLDHLIDGHPVSPDSPEVIRTGLYFVGGRGVLVVTADGHKCNERLSLIQKAASALAAAHLQ